jgi:hypothetical protein
MAKPFRSPLLGYNHNLNHRGRVFHVQTEDSGPGMPRLFTHLFYEGTILVSRKHEYDRDLPDDQVRALMRAQHKTVIKELMQARLDERIMAFFATRGEDLVQVPGAVPQAALHESSGPVMVLPQALGGGGAEALGDVGAGLDSNARVEAAADAITEAVTDAVIDADVDNRSQAYADVQVGRPAADIPTVVVPRRTTTTRPIEASQRRAVEAHSATQSPVAQNDGRRPPLARGGGVLPVSAPSAGDRVVVQRNVVVGGTAPSARPPRIRPPVPYVVTGGGHADRIPKTAPSGASGAQSKAATSHVPAPAAPPAQTPPIVPAASTGGPPSSAVPGPAQASGVEMPRLKTGFGVGRTDKSLDEVILEYLSEDGEPA